MEVRWVFNAEKMIIGPLKKNQTVALDPSSGPLWRGMAEIPTFAFLLSCHRVFSAAEGSSFDTGLASLANLVSCKKKGSIFDARLGEVHPVS